MHPLSPSWSVAIIAARESDITLSRCISAVRAACVARDVVIDVLVNGNPALAEAAGKLIGADGGRTGTVRVWDIAKGDKSHTWNEYVHRIWPGSEVAFFIDGYAEVRRGSLTALHRRLETDTEALGASGVPSAGRSAAKLREQMIRHGGFHGNLHAIRGSTLARLREIGFRIPLGLYRSDGLIGALLAVKLDPENHRWVQARIAVEPEATWDVPGLSALTFRNITSQFKRSLRQAQGELENRALRQHLSVLRRPAQQLPRTASELITQWIAAQPRQARSLFLKRPSCLYAAYKVRRGGDWSQAEIAPRLVQQTSRLDSLHS